MAAMGKLIEDLSKAGVLVTTGGLMSRNTGMKVTRKNGTYTVEDGPVAGDGFTEIIQVMDGPPPK
jgi:hypothetical protein